MSVCSVGGASSTAANGCRVGLDAPNGAPWTRKVQVYRLGTGNRTKNFARPCKVFFVVGCWSVVAQRRWTRRSANGRSDAV